jgi:large subunit ribosomal protein L14e
MPFRRYVEIGRIVLVNYGPDYGKLATIIDILDENRALVDGPIALTGVRRQIINFKRVALTDLKVNIPRSIRSHGLAAALQKGELLKKWSQTAWAKKLQQRKARANLTDFDRFKVMTLRKKRGALLRKEFLKVKKANPIKVVVKKAPVKKEVKPAGKDKAPAGKGGKDAAKGGKEGKEGKDAAKDNKAAKAKK